MCVLAVLGSQGIVVKCTAVIFSRTVDCEKLALMVFNLPPPRREDQVFTAECLQARHFRPHHNEKNRSSAANKRQKISREMIFYLLFKLCLIEEVTRRQGGGVVVSALEFGSQDRRVTK